MANESPKKRSRKTKPASSPTPARDRVPPPSVRKETLPPDAVARARQYYKDHAEILGSIWRSIYG